MSITLQVESSVQIVCKAGELVLRCRWWVLLACRELAQQATKDDFSRPTGPACRLPRVALEQMLALDLRIDMACILENERCENGGCRGCFWGDYNAVTENKISRQPGRVLRPSFGSVGSQELFYDTASRSGIILLFLPMFFISREKITRNVA